MLSPKGGDKNELSNETIYDFEMYFKNKTSTDTLPCCKSKFD
jgi:hypothetical protein